MSDSFAELGDYPPIVERQILMDQIVERIQELGPAETVDGFEDIQKGMDKVVRNNERMGLRIRLFDLKGIA